MVEETVLWQMREALDNFWDALNGVWTATVYQGKEDMGGMAFEV